MGQVFAVLGHAGPLDGIVVLSVLRQQSVMMVMMILEAKSKGYQ